MSGDRTRSRPRIMHITTSDSSLELLLRPQLLAFRDAGYEVVTASAPGRYVSMLEQAGIRHVALHRATRSMDLRRDINMLGELYQVFRAERPDIVHTHNPKPGWFGRIAARTARVPVVMNTVHGLYATEIDPRYKRFGIYGLERLSSAFSDLELVQNPEDTRILRKLGVPARKLVTLGNGVDLDRFAVADDTRRAAARAALGLTDDEVAIGVVGRLVWEKGLREVFEAARRLPGRVKNARVFVVGPLDPEKSDGLRAADIEAVGDAANIEFLGERADIEDIYNALDIYVLASHREGFPRSAMEAAASGLPIVASDIRGCRQVVEHERTGLLFPVRKVGGLIDAIVTLAENPELRREMGAAARRKAAKQFDQRDVIATVLDAYEQQLARTAGRVDR